MLGYNFKNCMNSHQIKNNLLDFLQKKKQLHVYLFQIILKNAYFWKFLKKL